MHFGPSCRRPFHSKLFYTWATSSTGDASGSGIGRVPVSENLLIIRPLSYHYEDELERFRKIFNVRRQRPHVRQLFMAGNHDIGFGTGLVVPAYNRFVRDFGNTSYIISTGNHDVIVLDTIALSTFDGPIKDRALEVFKQAVKLAKMNVRPRILFTHVPLYRPFGEPCGRNRRARNMINQARGYQYQNLVDEHLTQFILDDIRRTMIFISVYFITLYQTEEA